MMNRPFDQFSGGARKDVDESEEMEPLGMPNFFLSVTVCSRVPAFSGFNVGHVISQMPCISFHGPRACLS